MLVARMVLTAFDLVITRVLLIIEQHQPAGLEAISILSRVP